MKIRNGFVTNSSSSSFLCVAKVDLTDELRAYMKEEFGRYGERLLKENLQTGAEIKAGEYSEIRERFEDDGRLDELEDDAYYLGAWFIEWTNDGDTEGDDAFLYNNIPDKYMKEIYNENEA